jgi:hypothetical protein
VGSSAPPQDEQVSGQCASRSGRTDLAPLWPARKVKFITVISRWNTVENPHSDDPSTYSGIEAFLFDCFANPQKQYSYLRQVTKFDLGHKKGVPPFSVQREVVYF